MMCVWFQGDVRSAAPVIPVNPWMNGNVTAGLFELATPTSYIQRDSWLTATIAVGAQSEVPATSQYYYMPSNNWMITNSVTAQTVGETPTPTSYLQAS